MSAHPFAALTPDLVLDAVESLGFLSDARVLALNSYENRVYQVGIEDKTPLIASFIVLSAGVMRKFLKRTPFLLSWPNAMCP